MFRPATAANVANLEPAQGTNNPAIVKNVPLNDGSTAREYARGKNNDGGGPRRYGCPTNNHAFPSRNDVRAQIQDDCQPCAYVCAALNHDPHRREYADTKISHHGGMCEDNGGKNSHGFSRNNSASLRLGGEKYFTGTFPLRGQTDLCLIEPLARKYIPGSPIIMNAGNSENPENPENPDSRRNAEKKHVLHILQTSPNLNAAAKRLGINRGTLYDLIERFGFIRIWVARDAASSSPPQGI